jgi:DNA polymerase III alpha subunit
MPSPRARDVAPEACPRAWLEHEVRGGGAFAPGSRPSARVDALVSTIPDLPEFDARHRMRAELEILEMTLDAHPFALFGETLDRVRRLRPVVASTALCRLEGKEVYLLGWKVTAKRTTTVDDEPMCFVTFSDEHGRFEASFFPEVYAGCALELVRGMGPFLVKGRVELSFGVAEVVASHVKLLRMRGDLLASVPNER